MKNIFRSLAVLLMPLFFTGQVLADETVTGKVRYAIEFKQLTKQQAQQAVTNGYIDLYTYAFFDEGFIGHGITLNGNNKVQTWNLRFGQNSHSYVICDANGNFDQSGAVAIFAPAAQNPSNGVTCSAPTYQDEVPQGPFAGVGVLSPGWQSGGCPTWNFGAECGISAAMGTGHANFSIDTVIDGKRWFGVKMYKIRYIYKDARSFYTRFYVGPSLGTMSIGSSNMNLYSSDAASTLIFGQGVPRNNQDWSYYMQYPSEIKAGGSADNYGLWIGGVEVIADPDMELTADATCGGSDVTGKLNVNDWAGKDWSNYQSVKFYVNATGGSVSSRKPLTLGSDITATVPTSGAADMIDYALTPAGYTLSNGSYADSLIWVIEDTFLA